MLRFVAYWFAASLVTGALWALIKGVRREIADLPENDDEVRERMELQRQREEDSTVSRMGTHW